MDQFCDLEEEKSSLEPFVKFCPRGSSRRNVGFPDMKVPMERFSEGSKDRELPLEWRAAARHFIMRAAL